MRVLLERSRSARSVVALVAAVSVLGLAHSASAGGDLGLPFGLRPSAIWSQPEGPAASPASAAAEPVHRQARRIWAASGTRPLRITLGRLHGPTRLAGAKRPAKIAAGPRRPSGSQTASAGFLVLPKPPRPALVSIYQDRTLRDGDAVMMADGIHLFHGTGAGPYRPRDFVRLQFAGSLGWRLRATLNDLDRNPPTRWSSMGSVSG